MKEVKHQASGEGAFHLRNPAFMFPVDVAMELPMDAQGANGEWIHTLLHHVAAKLQFYSPGESRSPELAGDKPLTEKGAK